MDKEKRERAQRVKKELAGRIGGGSDHLLLIQTYKEWREQKLQGRERAYCSRSFLSNSTMMMIDGMREQLQKELQDRHLITSLQVRRGIAQLLREWFQPDARVFIRIQLDRGYVHRERVPTQAIDLQMDASRKAGSMKLVRSLLLLGLYPFTGRVLPPGSSRNGSGRDGSRQMLMTAKNNKVVVHPASITNAVAGALQPLAGEKVEELRLMVFDEVMRGESSMYVRQCSIVPPHALVLVASKVQPRGPQPRGVSTISSDSEWSDVDEEKLPTADEQPSREGRKRTGTYEVGGREPGDQASPVLAVDGWLELEVPFASLGHICCMRERISAAFAFKVQHPQHALPPMLQDALDTTAKVLTSPCATLPGLDPTPAAARPRTAAEAAGARGRGRAQNSARCPVPPGPPPGRRAGHSGAPPRSHAGGRGGGPAFPGFGMTHEQVLANASAGVSPVRQPPAPPLPSSGVMVMLQPQPPPPPPPPHGQAEGWQMFQATQPTRQPAPPPPALRHPHQPRHHQHHHHQPHQAVPRQQLPPPPPPPPQQQQQQQDAAKGDRGRGRGRGRSRGGGRSRGRH